MREDKERYRQYDLGRLKLTLEADARSTASSSIPDRPHTLPLKTIIHLFDAERSDITLFFNLFEHYTKNPI